MLSYNWLMNTTNPNRLRENPTPRIVALTVLGVLLLLALTGCQNNKAESNHADIAGVYPLVSVNGSNVPCALSHGGTAMTVKSGELAIHADGSCRSLVTFSVAGHKDINREVKAHYTRQGNELTMRWVGAGTTKGQINGNEFTMNNEGMVFLYRK